MARQGKTLRQHEDERRHAGVRRNVAEVEEQRVQVAVHDLAAVPLPLAGLRVRLGCRLEGVANMWQSRLPEPPPFKEIKHRHRAGGESR